jgi:hypothetical protein
MLDEHHGQVELRDDRPDERAQLPLLVRVHSRRRLVHQERGRTERESAGDLEPALVAVGQPARGLPGPVRQPDALEEVPGAAANGLLLDPRRR